MEWPPSATQFAVLVTLTVVAVDIIRRLVRNRIERKGYPLPPGPSQLATLKTMFSAKSLPNLLMCADLRAKHGDLIYFDAVGTDIILLNSTSLARELLEKRSLIYSDRPAVMADVAPFYDFNLAFLRYGEYWRMSRRIWHQSFRAESALRFRPMQLRRARQLLVNIIDNPDEYPAHFSTFSVSITLSAGYDYEPIPQNDPMVSVVENFVRFSGPGMAPGKVIFTMVFPFLRHISGWLPGPWFQRHTKVANMWKNELLEKSYQYVQERMESKDHMNGSMVWDHINETEKPAGSYRSESGAPPIKGASASALSASLNTTAPTLMVFILAMVKNPRVWKRAQAEIDAVVGTERLPEFDDRASLPYVDAILREVFRWAPVLPLGGLHATTQSDIYEGYYIPKGTVLATNVWAISREEARYPDGDNFIPERFLDAEGTLTDDNPSEFIFGFGRRICPGRHVADGSLWASMATMLATLDFNLAKDADGNDIAFEATFGWGLPRHPNPFPCRLTPRPHIKKEVIEHILSK